jgi:hypothetical protein
MQKKCCGTKIQTEFRSLNNSPERCSTKEKDFELAKDQILNF